MTVREGSLEAPTRHPVAWRSPDFYDEAKLSASSSGSSASATGAGAASTCARRFRRCSISSTRARRCEVDGVPKQEFWKVVDQCYLCDMCYMTKCPYVPPHPWNVDFPHLMLRAPRRSSSRRRRVRFRDRLLSSTDAIGKLAAIPVVAQVVNAVNRNSARAR